MGRTTDKGEMGEAEVIVALKRMGYQFAIPLGHSLPFDLILIADEGRRMERVQVKYTTSNGRVVKVRCSSHSAWVAYKYSAKLVDWLATYDATTNRVYFVHSCVWDGLAMMNLRLVEPVNGQIEGIRWAKDFTAPTCGLCGSQQPEPAVGIEPTAARLRGECSTTELRWLDG